MLSIHAVTCPALSPAAAQVEASFNTANIPERRACGPDFCSLMLPLYSPRMYAILIRGEDTFTCP